MKNKSKTIIAFLTLTITVITGFLLSVYDTKIEFYPKDDTKIRLYGEAHGSKIYYDIEFETWKKYYDQGCRSLFVELPYYTAEYINLWMKADSNEILNQIFEDIQGTQSCNNFYKAFFQEIKEKCPQTIFYGTDVGHQYDTTGARYLKYLVDKNLESSANYKLAEDCIKQGKEFYADSSNHNGVSAVREKYLISNFIKAYSRCGSDKIMGIYGSYHTDLNKPDLMAGSLKAHYGDVISSVRISSMAFGENRPYRFGFCLTGLIFLMMLFIPNIYWGAKAKPQGYDEAARNENKILLFFERTGEALVSCSLLIFPSLNPYFKILPEGLFFDWKIIIYASALVLMILYEGYWIKYFRSKRTLKDQYSSFAGFPLAGASFPVLAVILLGLYSMNLIVIISGLILGIGHIGIHWMHSKEILTKEAYEE